MCINKIKTQTLVGLYNTMTNLAESLRNPNYRVQRLAEDVAEMNFNINNMRIDITTLFNRLDDLENNHENRNNINSNINTRNTRNTRNNRNNRNTTYAGAVSWNNTNSNNTNTTIERNIAEIYLHMGLMREHINELQREMADMREWRNTITPMFEVIARGVEQTNQNQQNLQQATDQ